MDSSFCGFHDELDDDWKVFTEPQLTSSEEDSSDMDGTCHTGSPLNLKAHKVSVLNMPLGHLDVFISRMGPCQ